MNSLQALLQHIAQSPERVEFDEVIAVIDQFYHYTETRFTNGLGEDALINEAGSNAGSCRVFAFARQNKLDEESTLACFGRYYREDVLRFPDGNDHGNIRRFMKYGWQGIYFDDEPLTPRKQ
ncbi:MAG: type III effector [Gammaproteobacteria bacterium HGW-Gammaproteobacteria-14]|nr:MAG: type III effector [Gammaproteobacteria bacterium HGW-Gammaproteobacteria-14]